MHKKYYKKARLWNCDAARELYMELIFFFNVPKTG